MENRQSAVRFRFGSVHGGSGKVPLVTVVGGIAVTILFQSGLQMC